MTRKRAKFSALLDSFQGQDLEPHYLGYFDCFNRGRFFEAHEVLEVLWLPERGHPRGLFYQGLIQLAGAFVHLQKNRLKPAAAVLRLARANLKRYPEIYERFEVVEALRIIAEWLAMLEEDGFQANPLCAVELPKLALCSTGASAAKTP